MCTVIKLFAIKAHIKYRTRNVGKQSGLFMNLGHLSRWKANIPDLPPVGACFEYGHSTCFPIQMLHVFLQSLYISISTAPSNMLQPFPCKPFPKQYL